MTETPHERLDRLMNERRLELSRMKWSQVAEKAGITVTTLAALRKGENAPTEDTKRGVEDALDWTPGSIDRILEGGDPGQVHYASARLEASTAMRAAAEVLEADPLAQRPGESGFEYLDRILEEWRKIRSEDDPADQVRERVIRGALEGIRDRDAS